MNMFKYIDSSVKCQKTCINYYSPYLALATFIDFQVYTICRNK